MEGDVPGWARKELSPGECVTLASGRPAANLAAAVGGDPMIFPVMAAVGSDALVVGLSDPAALHAVAQRRVAVEFHQLDPTTREGWSVVVQGVAFDITDTLDSRSGTLRRLARPWPAQGYPHLAMVTLGRVSGRRSWAVPPRTPATPVTPAPAT